MKGWLSGALAAGCLLLAVGAGGWWVWSLQQESAQLGAHLQETLGSLAGAQEVLGVLQEARSTLEEEYDALRARWAKTDEERVQLSETAERTSQELAAVSDERAALSRQLSEMDAARRRLAAQTEVLAQDTSRVNTERAALQAELDDVLRRSLSAAEAEQVAEALSAQREEQVEASPVRSHHYLQYVDGVRLDFFACKEENRV